MFSFNRAYSDRIIWKNWHLVLKNNTLNILVRGSILRSKTREKRGWSNVLAAKNKKNVASDFGQTLGHLFLTIILQLVAYVLINTWNTDFLKCKYTQMSDYVWLTSSSIDWCGGCVFVNITFTLHSVLHLWIFVHSSLIKVNWFW